MMVFDFWKGLPPRTKRIMTIAVFFLIALIVSAIGTLTPLTAEEASAVSTDYNQTMDALHAMSPLGKVTLIFGNNFMLCLLAFVPIVGIIFELYVLYSTGVVVAAISFNTMNPLLAFLLLFVFPVAWLEFLAYSMGMAESFWLTRRIFQHRGRRELVNTCKFISITAVTLLAAAIMEVALLALL